MFNVKCAIKIHDKDLLARIFFSFPVSLFFSRSFTLPLWSLSHTLSLFLSISLSQFIRNSYLTLSWILRCTFSLSHPFCSPTFIILLESSRFGRLTKELQIKLTITVTQSNLCLNIHSVSSSRYAATMVRSV